MYLPSSFHESDTATLHEFIERNSFGVLVSQLDGSPFATHLPFLLDRTQGPHGTLFGHLARANPQWHEFSTQPGLAIFTGPHAYISPTWYETENMVPTWNYVAVHAMGRIELVEDPEQLLGILRQSVDVYERGMPQPWNLGERTAFVDKLLQQIVGFRLVIEQLHGKWKLNQNHPEERRKKVISALATRDDENSKGIAELMRQRLSEAALSDTELLAAFLNGELSHQQWNHKAHLRTGYLLVEQLGLEGAITKMRAGLQELNTRHGSPNTLMRGYHETITVAFLRFIHERLTAGQKFKNSQAFCDVHDDLLDKQLLLRYYSSERLWSWDAKNQFLEPDLQPIPTI